MQFFLIYLTYISNNDLGFRMVYLIGMRVLRNQFIGQDRRKSRLF